MSTDVHPRPTSGFARWLAGAFAVSITVAAPALAQFTPRFETLAPVTVRIGDEPGKHSFVLADLNADRRLDIVAIEPGDSRVDVYINRGDGTFEQGAIVEDGGITPTSVAVADVGSSFDSSEAGKPDGKVDIIVGGDSGEVALLFGNGDGQFRAPDPDEVIEPDATLGIVGLVVDDFDEGNGLDIALLDEDGVVLLCNDGNANFSECTGSEPLAAGSDPVKIAKGDFDGDADLDVAVLNASEQNVQVLFGNGSGSFSAPMVVDVAGEARGSETSDFAVGRIDGDNLDDFVAINFDEVFQFIAVSALGLSNRRFDTKTFVGIEQATAITLADFDAGGDRAADAITGVGGGSSGVRANIGDGSGGFGDPFTPIGTNTVGQVSVLASGDLGGDTLPDFIALNAGGTQLRVGINTSNEATPTPGPVTPGQGTPTFTPTGPGVTSTVTGTPTPTFSATPTNTPTPIPTANYGLCDGDIGGTTLVAIATGDLDGDGRPDLAVSDAGAGVVRIIGNATNLAQVKACAMAMSGRPLAAQSVALGGRTPGPIAIADLDQDGSNEIAVGAGDRVLLLTRSGTTFAVAAEVAVGGTVRAIAASYPDHPSDPRLRGLLDLNNDRRGDLVIANGTTTLTIVYGTTGLPGQATTQPTSCGATAVDAGDFNGDGRIDIAIGCGNRASWLQQQATAGDMPTFQPKNDFASGAPIAGVTAGYLDRNGLADLLITRGGSAPAGQSYLFGNGTFALAGSGSFTVGSNPIAGGLGRLNPMHNRFDAVIGGQEISTLGLQTVDVLQFAYNDSNGGFPGPVVTPFMLNTTPNALAVVDFDGDGQQDVVLANRNGTVTILVSSVPPPTPTPTVTPTATQTGTVTVTNTPSVTPTPTSTASATPQASATRTVTPGPSPTPTNTRGGIVLSSCAIGDDGGTSPMQMALIALLLAAGRLLAARRAAAPRTEHARR
jgi:hypothetical protein